MSSRAAGWLEINAGTECERCCHLHHQKPFLTNSPLAAHYFWMTSSFNPTRTGHLPIPIAAASSVGPLPYFIVQKTSAGWYVCARKTKHEAPNDRPPAAARRIYKTAAAFVESIFYCSANDTTRCPIVLLGCKDKILFDRSPLRSSLPFLLPPALFQPPILHKCHGLTAIVIKYSQSGHALTLNGNLYIKEL